MTNRLISNSVLCGLLLAASGCDSLQPKSSSAGWDRKADPGFEEMLDIEPLLKDCMPSDPNEPGTRAYYERRIVGQCALDGETLVPIRGADSAGVRSSGTTAIWLEGLVLDTRDDGLLVIGRAVTNASGAVRLERGYVLAPLPDQDARPTNAWLRALAVADGSYRYTTETGGGTLKGRREVREPTFEEYRRIYESDLAAPAGETVRLAPAASAESSRQRLERQRREREQALAEASKRVAEGGAAPQMPVARSSVSYTVPLDVGRTALPSVTAQHAFTYAITNGRAVITGYTGAGGDVEIPGELGGYPVGQIGRSAFNRRPDITGVTIPPSVSNIWEFAFWGCSGLTSLTIPEGPSKISLWWGAFGGCTSLTNVTLPSRNLMISASFVNCYRLRTFLVDPASRNYSSTADGVLLNRDGSEIVCFPGGKTGAYTVPEGVKRIGNAAFQGCIGLTELTVPESVISIGMEAFVNCRILESIRFEGHSPKLVARDPHLQDIFGSHTPRATVYYRPGTKGWGETFGGRPTKVWEED